METKHTKGNWSIDRESNNELWLISTVNETEPLAKICGADYPDDRKVVQSEETEANAKLISASPELLDCCRDILNMIQSTYIPESLENRIKAAIKKAIE